MSISELEQYRRRVSTAVGEISYLDIGQGPTALFVHGVGTNALLWRHVLAELAGERRCVALDLPLHGHTPATPDQDFSLTGLARVVVEFCTALDLSDVDLVANDTGGAVAQIVAVRQPDRLATFTLTNCETQGNVPPRAFKPTVLLARLGLLAPLAGGRSLRDLARTRKTVFAKSYQNPDALPDEVLRAYLAPVLGDRVVARQFQRWIAALHDRDLRAIEPALRELTVPTMMVWGTDDVFFDLRYAYWLRDTIPGATEVVEIPGGRLFFPDERAADLVPVLRRHWAAHRPG